jgi:hypothetical protein
MTQKKKTASKLIEIKPQAPVAFVEKPMEKKPSLEKTVLSRIETAMPRPVAKPMEIKTPSPVAFVEKPMEKKSSLEKTALPRIETAMPRPVAKPVERKITEERPVPEKTCASGPGIQKEYLEGKKICKVTFSLPKVVAPNGKGVFIVGDFNSWDKRTHQMKKQKNGDHSITLNLASGKEYQFRYLIDESIWENDWNADKYVKSPYGNFDNSVVVV